MNEREASDFEWKIAAYQDGSLDDGQLNEFETEMREDPEKLEWFIRVQRQTGAMIELFRNEVLQKPDDNDSRGHSVVQRTAPVGTDRELEPLAWRRTSRVWITIAAIAAAVIAMLTFATLANRNKMAQTLRLDATTAFESPQPESLQGNVKRDDSTGSIITYVSQAKWSDGSSPNVRDRLVYKQRYQLLSGATRFRMAGGAIVSIGGPAEFSIDDPVTIDFSSGRLTTRLPNHHSDLTIRAGDVHVRDLGTAFGLTMASDGHVDVAVFDGKVAASLDGDSDQAGVRTFGMGTAFTSEGEGDQLKQIPYVPEAYQDIWPLTAGINDVSGLIEFVPPGRNQSLQFLADDHKLFLVAERLSYRIKQKLKVDLLGAGQSWPVTQKQRHKVGKGRVVNSYLLIFQPDETDNETPVSLTGSITFQHEILGLAASPKQLRETDGIFGLPGIDFSQFRLRRLEHIATDSGRVPADILRISENGRELHFTLHASTGNDHIRVLVDEGNPATKVEFVEVE
ncbi:FecR domain-containing protein [Rubripirellula reticaptiva]|uniref:FecR protein n=1 Tax=Rubripirellula reticaptiva TaxID=2528013 RepID=A0A5C6FC51_9BACT|nr:FecR domain-containing protein [Rubripirellula reticaptiva]TWU58190.1 FecR protein [Rubripirellula reticaptiva]